MEWSPQQDAALCKIKEWLKDEKSSQVFVLFGYAGTGKTTLAKEIAEFCDGDVLFGAYTGKAAHVLQSKGCKNAGTIHSMIYKVQDPYALEPTFSFNRGSEVKRVELVIIDECSMIDEEMGKDLLSFGTKILVLGDPAQLPPISGAGFFTNRKPDFMLTEIHRQAADNPIIAMSIEVREQRPLSIGTYGENEVLRSSNFSYESLLDADQVIVGTNSTRRLYNNMMRSFQSFGGDEPSVGEKIICVRNDYRLNMFNGTTWLTEKVGRNEFQKRLFDMKISSLEDETIKKGVSCYEEFFVGKEAILTRDERKETQHFNYGYAITCHKSQGSQWDHIIVKDESRFFREDSWKWLYTALTRAAEKVTIVV